MKKRANADFIINKTEPPSAKFIYTPPPTFTTKIEKQRWLMQERQRWVEGYGGLTGYHYFYLTQCFIKIGAQGAIGRPTWRDCDEWIIDGFAEAKKKGFDFGLISRREIGKTSLGGGLFPNYFMRVNPGSTSLLTSCDKPRVFRMFNDKTAVVYDNMDKDVRGKVERRNQTKDNVYLQVRYPILNEYGETVYRNSDIYCSETVDNPSAFSSVRAIYGYYDEFPLHSRGSDLLKSSKACYMEGTEKTGTVFWAGTVESEVDQASLNRLRTIVGDSKNSNTVLCFAPYWWGLKQFMVNGHSDEAKGKEWWEKECERYSKLQDKTELTAFLKNYPPDLDTALDTATTGTLPKECMAIISEQRKKILNNPPPIEQGYLIRNENGGIDFRHSRDGKIFILTRPDKEKNYSSGTDPIPFNDSKLTDGSEYSINIYEDDTDTMVAYYAERSLDSEVVINNCILLQEFYNNTPTMMERNAGGVAIEKYKDNNKTDLLANKPTSLGIKFVDKRTTKGYYKNEKTSARGNELLIKYILRHGQNIWFKRMVDELEGYLVDNTDLLDGFIATLFMSEDKVKKKVKAMVKPEYREVRMLKRIGGVTTWVWEKVRVDGKEVVEE